MAINGKKRLLKEWIKIDDDDDDEELPNVNKRLFTHWRRKKRHLDYQNEDVLIDGWDSSDGKDVESKEEFKSCLNIEDFEQENLTRSPQSRCDIEIGSSPVADCVNIVDDDDNGGSDKDVPSKTTKNLSLQGKITTGSHISGERRFRKRLFSDCGKDDDGIKSINKKSFSDDDDDDVFKIVEFVEPKEKDFALDIESDDIFQGSESHYQTSPIIGKEVKLDAEAEKYKMISDTSDSESVQNDQKCSIKCSNETKVTLSEESMSRTNEEVIISSLESPLKDESKKCIHWLKTLDWKIKTPEQKIECQRNLHDSDKKKKFIKGGYAERLKKLISREESAFALWKYQLDSMSKTNKDHQTILTLQIHIIRKHYSVYLAECNKFNPDDLLANEKLLDSQNRPLDFHKCFALFSEKTVNDYALRDGCIVRVHSPWQILKTSHQEPLILCTYFTEFVSRDVKYNAICQKKIKTEYQYSCSEVPEKKRSISSHPNSIHSNQRDSLQLSLPNLSKSICSDDFLELEEIHCKNLTEKFSCIASVQRILQYFTEKTYKKRWSLMLMDKNHHICELQLLPSIYLKDDAWKELLTNGEGFSFKFNSIRIMKKMDRNNSPTLFSLIDKIQERNSKNLKDGSCTKQLMCYILGIDDNLSQVQCITSCQKARDDLNITNLTDLIQDYNKYCRIDLLVKVFHRHKEELWVVDRSWCSKKRSTPTQFSINFPHVAVIHCTSSFVGCGIYGAECVVLIRDVLLANDELVADHFSMLYCFTCLKKPVCEFVDNLQIEHLLSFVPGDLEELNQDAEERQLVIIKGNIVDVDISNAYLWLVCDACSSSILTERNGEQNYLCESCGHTVVKPNLKMNLEVVMKMPSLPDARIKIKFTQKHIKELLTVDSLDNFEGCDMSCIMNKSVGPLNCCVVSIIKEDNRIHFLLQEI